VTLSSASVQDEFGDDLRALISPLPNASKVLKQFHSITDPGAIGKLGAGR
jgi:hypothetical protein